MLAGADGESILRITVFGATGQMGHLLVGQALDAGHAVTAYARNPERLGHRLACAAQQEHAFRQCLLLRSRVGDLDEMQRLVKVARMPPPLRRVEGEDGTD